MKLLMSHVYSCVCFSQEYMKNILGHLEKTNPERIAVFKQAAKRQVQKILDTFKDWQFFLGESSDQDGMVALMNFREDGVTPYMLFWKDGLVEEKVVCVLCVYQHYS